MVEDHLLSRPELGFNEWAVTPSPDALTPQSVKRERVSKRFKSKVRDSGQVILTHGDADGLTSAALIEMATGPTSAIETVSYHGPYTLMDALTDLYDMRVSERDIFILDFNPDNREASDMIRQLVDLRNNFTWFDHHQWDDDLIAAYSREGVSLNIDTDECTASLIGNMMEDSFTETTFDLIEVTKDRDLWINEDPRSKTLSTFAEIAEIEEYVGTVIEHGATLPEPTVERVQEQIRENELLNEEAVLGADFYEVGGERMSRRDRGDLEVAITYISGGVNSEIGNELVEDQGADIAVVMTPYGGASIYSHSDRETFAQCHEVAGRFGGGGHPTASGFGFDFQNFRAFADYWAKLGRSGQRAKVLQTIEEVWEGE